MTSMTGTQSGDRSSVTTTNTSAQDHSSSRIPQTANQELSPDTSLKPPPESYEETHVHKVYNQIASHFSSTRYNAWPMVSSFLLSIPSGSIGLDIGCGNGKYLLVNPNLYIIASDRSSELVSIAANYGEQKNEVVVADGLSLPHQSGRFDFAISIAVVHHLSTRERRREAVKSILQTLNSDGKAMLYVWALEQKSSRRGWDKGGEQDIMVPWVMRKSKKEIAEGEEEKTYQRYYHLYRKGELEEDVLAIGGRVLEAGYEKDNWWCICSKSKFFADT